MFQLVNYDSCITSNVFLLVCISTNIQCVCTNAQFQQASEQCLLSKCTTADQATALALQQSQCRGRQYKDLPFCLVLTFIPNFVVTVTTNSTTSGHSSVVSSTSNASS